MASKIDYNYKNKNNFRMKWTEDKISELVLLWEWASYDRLKDSFPNVGLDSLGTTVNRLRKKGYSIPERKITGKYSIKWQSKVTGLFFVATPKYRSKDGKKMWTILVNGKRIYRFRYEMEQIIGRPLMKNEEVHHLDCNPENDNPDNLVLVNKKEHFPFDNLRANMAEKFIKEMGLWDSFLKKKYLYI